MDLLTLQLLLLPPNKLPKCVQAHVKIKEHIHNDKFFFREIDDVSYDDCLGERTILYVQYCIIFSTFCIRGISTNEWNKPKFGKNTKN
jgi:hypothetical protein